MGMAKKLRDGEKMNGERVAEEMAADGVTLGNKMRPLEDAGEEISPRKGQVGGKNWEGMLEGVGGDQFTRLEQEETGKSNSQNQIVEDVRRRKKS